MEVDLRDTGNRRNGPVIKRTVQFVGFFWTFTMKLNELVSQMELAKHYQDGLLTPENLGLASPTPLPQRFTRVTRI